MPSGLSRLLRSLRWKFNSICDADVQRTQVSIGPHSFVGSDVFPCYGSSGEVIIGKYCAIATGAKILVSGEHRIDSVSSFYKSGTNGPVRIGNDVWVGINAVILSGVTIGDGAVVGAGAVVASDVPPYAVVYGNPSKVRRFRFSQEQIASLEKIAWWDWPEETVQARTDDLTGDVERFIEKYGGSGR